MIWNLYQHDKYSAMPWVSIFISHTLVTNLLFLQQFLSVKDHGHAHVSGTDKISSDQKYEPSANGMGYMFCYILLEIVMFILISCHCLTPASSTNMDWFNQY